MLSCDLCGGKNSASGSIFRAAVHVVSAAYSGSCALDTVSGCVLSLIHGVFRAILDGFALFALLRFRFNRFARDEAQRFDQTIGYVIFRIGIQHVALVALIEHNHVPASARDVF